ncbi:MAG: metallophosphoesterase [Bacteroidales bacterium]|nr:metallophosphoesterase [Bacteroidales bacterium]
MRYCIGDIHGCNKTLKELINQILLVDKQPELLFVGDLIDRGPNSKAVIDYILEFKDKGLKINCVRGNHEEMLIHAYKYNQKITDSNWNFNGAENTIRSFNALADLNKTVKDLMPEKYYRFLDSLPYFIELDDYLIVHAGFNFYAKNPFADFETMLWTREEYNKFEFTKGKIIIHGHTPVPIEQIKSRIKNKNTSVINIDSGCVFTNLEKLGTLTALNMDNLTLLNVKNRDL